jgi:hypothetical protein
MTDTQQQPDSIPKEYREALEAFVKRIQKRALAVSVDEPVQVPAFHYTNADGVRGILQSKAIWLTDILHLNDPSELKFGMDPARARLHEHLQKSTNELAKRFLSDLDLLITKDVFDVFGFYVASFSLDGDHLDQWRAYADNGRDYCIEFFKSIFTGESLAANPAGRVLPVRIEYGRDTIENAQKLVIDEVVNLMESLPLAAPKPSAKEFNIFMHDVGVESALIVVGQAIDIKHKAYEREQEVRLLLFKQRKLLGSNVLTRVINKNLVPYVSHPMAKGVELRDVVRSVRIGPAAPEIAEKGLRHLLDSVGCEGVPVRRSEIPYRAI